MTLEGSLIVRKFIQRSPNAKLINTTIVEVGERHVRRQVPPK